MKHPIIRKIGYGVAGVVLASALGASAVMLSRSMPYQSAYRDSVKYAENKLNKQKKELQKQLPLIEQESATCKKKAASEKDIRSCETTARAHKSRLESDIAGTEKELKNVKALAAREESERKINDANMGLVVFFSAMFSVLAGCFMDTHSKNSSGKSNVSTEIRGVA